MLNAYDLKTLDEMAEDLRKHGMNSIYYMQKLLPWQKKEREALDREKNQYDPTDDPMGFKEAARIEGRYQ